MMGPSGGGHGAHENGPELVRLDMLYSINLGAVCSGRLLDEEDGFITAGRDRTLRVWLKRETGSLAGLEYFEDVTALRYDYSTDERLLFLGFANGFIEWYKVHEDFNRVTLLERFANIHTSTVTGLEYCPSTKWLLSTSNDQTVSWTALPNQPPTDRVETSASVARRLSRVKVAANCTCIAVDESTFMAFVGLLNGNILFIRLESPRKAASEPSTSMQPSSSRSKTTPDPPSTEYCVTNSSEEYSIRVVTELRGHQGSIRDLAWDARRAWLFSASYDNSVFVWDVGGGQGTVIELNGHKRPVQAVFYVSETRQLISAGEDQTLCYWDMGAERQEVQKWQPSDICQRCGAPFFWNWKEQWAKKVVGSRQHHCRRCGRAICQLCSDRLMCLPNYGFEYPVRVCRDCYANGDDEDSTGPAESKTANAGGSSSVSSLPAVSAKRVAEAKEDNPFAPIPSSQGLSAADGSEAEPSGSAGVTTSGSSLVKKQHYPFGSVAQGGLDVNYSRGVLLTIDGGNSVRLWALEPILNAVVSPSK